MSRKREPLAEHIAECGVLVRHTHDVELASRLALDLLNEEREDDPLTELPYSPHPAWVRIVHCLPNSYGEGEGWSWAVHPAREGERGAFRAVEFYS